MAVAARNDGYLLPCCHGEAWPNDLEFAKHSHRWTGISDRDGQKSASTREVSKGIQIV
jgi:hypothetical protein